MSFAMKRYAVFVLFILFFLVGCGRTHYLTVEERNVRVFLKHPDASTVLFASSLNGFEPVEAKKTDDAIWTVVVPKRSEFRYFYVVDGTVFVPPCPFKEQDDFGSQNCIYVPDM
jgi:hypothetical protein